MNATPERDRRPADNIKVVHVITGLSTGGAEMMLYKLLAAMDRARFDNRVVSLTDGGRMAERIGDLGLPVTSLSMTRGVPDPRALYALIRLLRRERPDLVQTWLYHADLLGLLAARLAGVPGVAWNLRCSFMGPAFYRGKTRLLLKLLSALSRQPQAIVVNSKAGRQLHEDLGYHPRRWVRIPNGFDTETFRPDAEAPDWLRQELGLHRPTRVIGYVARDDPIKDHETFLRAAALLLERRPDCHFVLVGDGITATNENLTAFASRSGRRGHFHFLGWRQDTQRISAGLDIASLTSRGEGFSNVLGEAMACGVPCVATDVGDNAAIIGDTGRLVPVADPAALATAWDDLLSRPPSALTALGQRARQRIRREFSLARIAASYETLYAELAGSSHARNAA